jgi:chlorite dismutase
MTRVENQRPGAAGQARREGIEPEARSLYHYAAFRVEPAWRRLEPAARDRGRDEFAAVVEAYAGRVTTRAYSTAGLRADADLILWRITPDTLDLETLQEMGVELLNTRLGRWCTTPYAFTAMTKASPYTGRGDPDSRSPGAAAGATPPDEDHLRGVPAAGAAKYLFVYPFVKTREWYALKPATRGGMMREHIVLGRKYPSVRINTSYSFGLDDQEFVVAFETDHPDHFLDLVQELRESDASRYTLRDTPMFTGIRRDLRDALRLL